jgi:phage tail protein X
MIVYMTKDGDMLDRICHAYYGRQDGVVEKVFEVNRHLAGMPSVLEAGVKIVLPDLPQKTEQAVKLGLHRRRSGRGQAARA